MGYNFIRVRNLLGCINGAASKGKAYQSVVRGSHAQAQGSAMVRNLKKTSVEALPSAFLQSHLMEARRSCYARISLSLFESMVYMPSIHWVATVWVNVRCPVVLFLPLPN